jgi:hypothetical protein
MPYIWCLVGPWPPPRWPSSAARGHAVVVSVLTPAEVLIAARRLAGARPLLAALAGILHQEDLWQLCRDEPGLDVRIDGWDPRSLVRRGRRGAAARGLAARRDDPVAGDRRPDRTARTPRLVPTRWNPVLAGGNTNALLSAAIVRSGGSAASGLCCGNPCRAVQDRVVRSFRLAATEQSRPDRHPLRTAVDSTLSVHATHGERAHSRAICAMTRLMRRPPSVAPSWMI